VKQKIRNTGLDEPGIPTIDKKPHLGNLILRKLGHRIAAGFDDLKRFELIDRLEKPVLNFGFYGTKKIIIELYDFLVQFPYAFVIRTRKGLDLWSLPERGVRAADVHISRFPKLIKFIKDYEDKISNDLWGLLYGYPLAEVHQFTYDWEKWAKKKKPKVPARGADIVAKRKRHGELSEEVDLAMIQRLCMEVDDEVVVDMSRIPEGLAGEMRLAAAVKWYEMGIIGQEKAAQLACMGRAAFINALSRFGVSPFQETTEEKLDVLNESGE
jgi:hypothetical protein